MRACLYHRLPSQVGLGAAQLWCNLCNVPYSLLVKALKRGGRPSLLRCALRISERIICYIIIYDIIIIPRYSLLVIALKSGGWESLLFANKQPNKNLPLERDAILLGLLTLLASITWLSKPVMSCVLSALYRFPHRLNKNETIRQCAKCQVWVVQRVC